MNLYILNSSCGWIFRLLTFFFEIMEGTEEYVKKNVKIFVSNYFLKVNFQKF